MSMSAIFVMKYNIRAYLTDYVYVCLYLNGTVASFDGFGCHGIADRALATRLSNTTSYLLLIHNNFSGGHRLIFILFLSYHIVCVGYASLIQETFP